MSWWRSGEKTLYERARTEVDRGRYRKALKTSMDLLVMVNYSEAKTAYIKGTLLAIALRHLKRDAEAKQVFQTAYEAALKERELAIAGYIRNNQASMASTPADAVTLARQAIKHLHAASTTPVLGRSLKYDEDFFYAILALHLNRAHRYDEARRAMARAKAGLAMASRNNAIYQHCYLLALQYELTEFRDGVSKQEQIARARALAKETLRQRKTWATLRIARRRLRQLLKSRD